MFYKERIVNGDKCMAGMKAVQERKRRGKTNVGKEASREWDEIPFPLSMRRSSPKERGEKQSSPMRDSAVAVLRLAASSGKKVKNRRLGKSWERRRH